MAFDPANFDPANFDPANFDPGDAVIVSPIGDSFFTNKTLARGFTNRSAQRTLTNKTSAWVFAQLVSKTCRVKP